ncbi:MAG: DUF1449 family protein [Candidatus Tectomicrobia bacterium]|uniref:DUF1449 family protein n=1 Tax=Tectimicrobiota bacterium TaxID=2528274 RepID=A0A932CQQ3_UNCTE|nr:DUF1449 family protein [Candidatus Tectomicrobia bacterium]
MEFLAWWNLIFLLPGSVGILLALLAALGVGDDHGPDVDAHVDTVAIETEVEADLEADHEADVHHGGGGLLADLLSLLGVGQVPLGILLTMLCLLFGFIGFGVNQLLAGLLPVWGFVPISLGAAALGSLFLTGSLARVVSRFLPAEESYVTSFEALAGQTGKVVLLCSPTEGYAQVRDRYGNLQEVHCQSLEGRPLQKGQPILIVEVQPQERICLVVENDLER